MLDLEAKNEKEFRRKLRDCGCSPKQTKEYLELVESGKPEDQIGFLKRRRNEALDELHNAEEQIYCIDFCIYELEKRR